MTAPLALIAGGLEIRENNLIELEVVNIGLGVITGVQAVILGWLIPTGVLATRRPSW